MNPAFLARSAMRTRAVGNRQLVRSDLYHFENTHGQNLPFKSTNRTTFAIKFVLFMGLGFSAPLLGAKWQFHKAG
ncbi:hypothetical protein BCR43DRAFT_484960 [Syncephalastrum racemosum]|uniref:Cytochrome c oxidase subunit 8, mitochondrial n=1 Tax=Syncephalastrum racemosum TaxID=13706 RepID=A0A1X2HLN7_SYNRA|nr:hypothetical protein BCR43DRAFT_484960 [Syncephalastrum racemosum]